MSLFVETKKKGFSGTKAGVYFANGKARVPKAVAIKLIRNNICYCESLGKPRPVEKSKVKNQKSKVKSRAKK